jgi:rRNA-processing protein Efg1
VFSLPPSSFLNNDQFMNVNKNMARDHKLDPSDFRHSTTSSRPDRDRSRSPKRPQSNSWRPRNLKPDESSPHNGRSWRRDAEPRRWNEYRERSPNQSVGATAQGPAAKQRKRPGKQNNDGETTGLSDRIHSLRRLLEKATDMPADVRLEKERELQGYLTDQQRIKAKRERKAVTSRYHFVRFLERKKAEKRLKQVERDLNDIMICNGGSASSQAANTVPIEANQGDDQIALDEASDLQSLSSTKRQAFQLQYGNCKRKLHLAKVDLNYTLYAPLDQKYIALYPGTAKPRRDQDEDDAAEAEQDRIQATKDDEAGLLRTASSQKPPLWYEVEKAMENNTLDALRDGKISTANKDGNHTLTFRSMGGPSHSKKVSDIEPASHDENLGDDSEDDFFER